MRRSLPRPKTILSFPSRSLNVRRRFRPSLLPRRPDSPYPILDDRYNNAFSNFSLLYCCWPPNPWPLGPRTKLGQVSTKIKTRFSLNSRQNSAGDNEHDQKLNTNSLQPCSKNIGIFELFLEQREKFPKDFNFNGSWITFSKLQDPNF